MSETKYANFIARLAAGLIDTVFFSSIAGTIWIVSVSLIAEYVRGFPPLGPALFTYFIFIPGVILFRWLYYALLWSSKHQATLGMRILGIKVVDYNHQRISFLQATGRYLAASLNFLIGYLAIAFTEKKQAAHDFIARTYTTYKD